MKIGFIHASLDMLGGAEQITYSLLDLLKDSRHKVTLYTTTTNAIVPDQIKVTHIKRNPLLCKIPGRRLQEILLDKQIFKKIKDEDILFISNAGGLRLEEIKNPTVMYCHSTLESPKRNVKKSNMLGVSRIYYNYIEKHHKAQSKILKKSSVHLITNSNYTKERIEKVFGKKSKLIFPPVKIDQNKSKTLKKAGVITVARFDPTKNLEFNLNVVKKINTGYKIFGNAKLPIHFNYYNDLLKKIEDQKRINFFCNVDRKLIKDSLYESKVYFSSSKETFGISVVEGIMTGCIPIVPDNTANKETVPIPELRYREDDIEDAQEHVQRAIEGDFDKHLDELQANSIEKFSEAQFQKNITEYLDEFEKSMNKKSK